MTVQELVELMNEQKALLVMEPTQELEKLCHQLQPYFADKIDDMYTMENPETTVYDFATNCLTDDPPFTLLGINDSGHLDGWHSPKYTPATMTVRISDVISGPSAADELTDLLSAF